MSVSARRAAAIAAVALPMVVCMPASAQRLDQKCDWGRVLAEDKVRAMTLHQNFEIYRKYDRNCDGKLSQAELEVMRADEQDVTSRALDTFRLAASAGEQFTIADSTGPRLASLNTKPGPQKLPTGLRIYLRDSAEDIGTYIDPKKAKTAGGLQFGYANDGVARNAAWSAKGIVTAPYVWRQQNPDAVGNGPYLAGFATGPWLSFNRLTNSSSALRSKEIDVLSAGGVAEAAVARVLDATHYLRAKGAVNGNFQGDVRSWGVAAEWQPVSNDWGIGAPNPLGNIFIWRIDPVMRMQYMRRAGGIQDPIFATHDQALRFGPVVALNIIPYQDSTIVPEWLQSAAINISFSYLYDTLSSRSYWLLNSSLLFPIDPEGHFGIKLAYQRGQLEETGQRVDQVTLGFGVKW